MHVVVVGAGIAGMTAAIALCQKGVEVTVLEQAPALKEIGAGIQLAANGSLVLRKLGLEDAVAQRCVVPQSWEMRDISDGKLLYMSPLGDAGTKRWGAPLYNIHRADLIDILAKALPQGVLRLGAQCLRFEQDADGVTIELTSGERLRCDALIGADGIHSVVREQLRGKEQTQVLDLADESTSPALLQARLSPYSCFSQPPAALLRRKQAPMSVAGNEGNHEIIS